MNRHASHAAKKPVDFWTVYRRRRGSGARKAVMDEDGFGVSWGGRRGSECRPKGLVGGGFFFGGKPGADFDGSLAGPPSVSRLILFNRSEPNAPVGRYADTNPCAFHQGGYPIVKLLAGQGRDVRWLIYLRPPVPPPALPSRFGGFPGTMQVLGSGRSWCDAVRRKGHRHFQHGGQCRSRSHPPKCAIPTVRLFRHQRFRR